MATYRSPFYPALHVAMEAGTVKFSGGQAEVPDELVDAFEAYLATYGREAGIIKASDAPVVAGQRDPADDLGPGYTPAEREAYRRARTQTAPPPPGDQRTDGVKTAASLPLLPADFTGEAAAVDPAVAAMQAEQELANARAAALANDDDQEITTAILDEQVIAAGEHPTEDGLDDLPKNELQTRLRDAGLATSGNRDELIARLREA